MRTFLQRFGIRLVLRRYEGILLGSLLLLTGMVMPSYWEPSLPPPPRPSVQLPKRPWIALTFDDGPHLVHTDRLLQTLRQERVPATFFVVGKMADRYPHLVQEIARQGHELANHTYTHARLSRLDNEAVLRELAQTRATLRRLTGRDVLLYRPPGGDFTRRIARTTRRAGYHMVLWTVLTRDVEGASLSFMSRRILDRAEDGGVILMHSGIPRTIELLPRVIARLRAQGYQFVTVSTLLGLPAPDGPVPSDALPIRTVRP